MNAPGDTSFTHGSMVVVGECGILIEGASGSGKSALAAALIEAATRRNCFGRLVGDDRVALVAVHGRLLGRPHPAVAGLLEWRGLGLVAVPHERAGRVHLVVRLSAEGGERLPDPPPTWSHRGVTLPMLPLRAGAGARENAARVLAALPVRAANHNLSNKLANSAAMHKIAPHEAAGGHVAGST